ncbi:MAG: hypothetical protein H6557_17985 [Lewinellaceae bacterium]|nr:hypothetical protein [Phaeodactylibacter sp.]MCB9038503.1 hypothetical protein [Lewinellaceae bacterium]
MALEDIHPDILQNIEFAIVSIYRDDPTLRDTDVIKALEALISHVQRLAIGREPAQSELPPPSEAVFNAVIGILEFRSGLDEEEEEETTQRRPRFSRALRKTTQEDIYLACLRKIHKSAKRWNRERGEQGYLEFVSHYIP